MTPGSHSDLPVHLAEHPTRRGLGRVGVGTAPFNVAALAMMVLISSFVVLGSTYVAEQAVDDSTAEALPIGAEGGDADTDTDTTDLLTVGAGSNAVESTSRPTPVASSTAPRRATPSAAQATPAVAPAPSTTTTTTPAPFVLSCDLFATQTQAQKAYDADPVGGVVLDGDGDGLACEQLPWAEVDDPTIVLPTTESLLRPSTRLYGVHTPEAGYAMHEVTSFAEDAGKTPNNVMFFNNFSREFPSSAVDNAWDAGMLPMITFEPIIEDSTEGQPLLDDITDGEWDEYFTQWAAAAAADGRPMTFRFGQEMNGNWYSWSDGRFGNDPGDFVAAWRHIHDLFDGAGADNVLFVWSVNRVDSLPDKSLWRVYPGDDYVDWVGISGYYRDASTNPTFDTTFAATLAELKKVAPSKVIMLTEVGAGTSEAQRVRWIESLFQGLLDHQEIIGFTWFNDFKSGGDWRIQYSSATTAAFADGVADSRYGSLVRVAGG